MTEQDMKELEAWQSSPEGELFMAINDMDHCLKLMEAHMRTRAGLQQLRASKEDLDDLSERLQTIRYAARVRELVTAAE